MPHITLMMLEGRTEEQKKKATERLTAALVETVGCTEDKISIAIVDNITGDRWQERLDNEISGKEQFITKKSNSIK